MSGSCFGSSNNEVPQGDNTPVGETVATGHRRNFVIILAGPGRYNPDDREHDQFWGNYFVAAQHIFGVPDQSGQFQAQTSLLTGECVHWLVYEKAYTERWESDKSSNIQFLREHASKYRSGYLARIKEYIKQLNRNKPTHRLIGIDSYKDVWETLHRLPDKSLTRLHYFGHGGPAAFFLRWESNTTRPEDELVTHSLMGRYSAWLTLKARPADGQISKFYACSSATWAKEWNKVTGLKAQGSTSTISFKTVREDRTLDSVEQSGRPWVSFP